MPSSANLCFHALALERGLLPRPRLDAALQEAEARGRPLDRYLVESNALGREVLHDVEVLRAKLARACRDCRKLTYLMPGGREEDTPCEHCMGTLDPASAPKSGPHPAPAKAVAPKSAPHAAPKSGTHAAPKSAPHAAPKSAPHAAPKSAPHVAPKSAPHAAPKSGTHATPKSGPHAAPKSAPHAAPKSGPHAAPKSGPHAAPKSGPHAAPKAATPSAAPKTPAKPPVEERRPALIEDAEDEGPPLPAKIGKTRIEAVLAQNDRLVIYAGRIGDERVAVRALRPERAEKRRDVDRFFQQAQAAAPTGLEPLDVGTDVLGAPYLAIKRPDGFDLGPVLLGLDALDASGEHGKLTDASTSGDMAGLFDKLNKERQQLMKDVQEASRRRERCVGRFVLLEPLRVDAGEQWRGFDTDSNELVAVRLLPAGRVTGGGRLLKDLDERLGVAKRARHAHLVPVREYGVDGGRLFIVREHVIGHPIVAGPDLEMVVKNVHQAAQALAYLHAQPTSHGGLHPGAVLIRHDRTAVLVDLGVAAAAAAAGETNVSWQVTRGGCSPPEWTPDQPDDAAGDVHALGAVLYRSVVHHLPAVQTPFQGEPDPPSDVLAIALRCLASNPAERYAGANDLARDLERVLDHEAPAAREPRPAAAEERPGSRVMGALSGVFKKWLNRGD